jgi:UDP-3-O-[3-hydroxymyristoyl] glucosamine N-acyltransferase
MSQVLELLHLPPVFHVDIHPTAVDKSATIGTGARIGAGSYVGPNVKIGENAILYPNVTILDECTIGKNTVLWSGTVVESVVTLVQIALYNAVIGADGFGFRPCPERGLVKIPQIGNVIIGNNVEIGANSCVDRGKFSSTVLGDGCKIDNLVQIGHKRKLVLHYGRTQRISWVCNPG